MDPEIPTLSVVDLGVIRDIEISPDRVAVTMTPTFAGCPAIEPMRRAIRERVEAMGAGAVEVKTQLAPPWTTDDITEVGREKLRRFGLAPPPPVGADLAVAASQPGVCPYCGSDRSELKNPFGSTPCRAIYYCTACNQPFEQFKPL